MVKGTQNENASGWNPVGDGSKHVGVFARLPVGIATQFPSLDDHDKSPTHVTVLYAGPVPLDKAEVFSNLVRLHFCGVEPVRATLDGLDSFEGADGFTPYFVKVKVPDALARARARFIDALRRSGIEPTGKGTDIWRPHVTLSYAEAGKPFQGHVPEGSFEIESVEVWGLPEHVIVPLGSTPIIDAQVNVRMDQFADLDDADLPPKPEDKDGRTVKWVLIARGPGFVAINRRNGEKVEVAVTDPWVSKQVKGYTGLQGQTIDGEPYEAPLLVEHQKNGEREGDVLALAGTTVKGHPALIAAVAFADPDIEEKIRLKKVRYFSPRFESIMDDRGVHHPFVLTEVSKTSAPHQKNMGVGSHVLASEGANNPTHTDGDTMPKTNDKQTGAGGADIQNNEGDAEVTNAEARLGQLETKMGEMAAQMGQLATLMEGYMKKPEEGEGEGEGADTKNAEVANAEGGDASKDAVILALTEQVTVLSGTVASLKADSQRKSFDALVESRADLALNEQSREAMFKLYQNDATSFEAMFSGVSIANAETVQTGGKRGVDFARTSGTNSLTGGKGGAGEQVSDHTEAIVAMHEEAMAEAGGDKMKAAQLFVEKRRALDLH